MFIQILDNCNSMNPSEDLIKKKQDIVSEKRFH